MTDDTALAVEVLKRMSAQDDTLSEIHAQTMKTNGRVTGLEMREAAREAVRIDRAERLKVERIDRANDLQMVSDKRDRKVMVFGAVAGMCSGAIGYAFLTLIHAL